MLITIGAVSLVAGFFWAIYRHPVEDSLEWSIILLMIVGGSITVMSGIVADVWRALQ